MALWIPRSVEQLEAAVTDGVVAESHHLDFKAFSESGKVPDTAAKCSASLAVDGGVLVVGVGEDKVGRRFVLQPRALTGLRDAMDSMVANRVSPTIRVTVDTLGLGDGTGYLVVVVPESARAPHMVDGRYYGRSDTAARPLADSEVRLLWLRHVDRRSDREALLRAEVDREPVPGGSSGWCPIVRGRSAGIGRPGAAPRHLRRSRCPPLVVSGHRVAVVPAAAPVQPAHR